MNRFLIIIFFLISSTSAMAQFGRTNPTSTLKPAGNEEISYLNPKEYIIGNTTISGVQFLEKDVLVTISKLNKGDRIVVPGEATSNAIKNLWAQGLFDDVQLNIAGTVGIEEIDFSNGIQVTSNIETGNISVAYNFNQLQNVRLTATDITGKVVYVDNHDNQLTNQYELNSKGWAAGIYNVTLSTDKGLTKTTKVVVQ